VAAAGALAASQQQSNQRQEQSLVRLGATLFLPARLVPGWQPQLWTLTSSQQSAKSVLRLLLNEPRNLTNLLAALRLKGNMSAKRRWQS
jgi:hypothetical protein